MRDEQKLREEIEATLNSLEGIQRAKPSYYFESKLITRLENKAAKKSSWLFPQLAFRPSIAVAVLSAFVILNVVTIGTLLRQKSQTASSTELQGFAQEYNLGTTTLYDTNTIK